MCVCASTMLTGIYIYMYVLTACVPRRQATTSSSTRGRQPPQAYLELPEAPSKKKTRSVEEQAIARSENARKRKMMAQKLAEETKVHTCFALFTVFCGAWYDDTLQRSLHSGTQSRLC